MSEDIPNDRSIETAWLDRERQRLEKEYPGKWLAVEGERIVGVGDELSEARAQAKANGVDHPFFEAMRFLEWQDVLIFRSPFRIVDL